jgi:hypothetical protein
MDGRQRPWWLWALAGLVALAALAGIILAVWKLPSLLYGDVSKASADARLQAASGFRTALVAGLAGLAAPGGLARTVIEVLRIQPRLSVEPRMWKRL